jgi:hypothetical protein
MLVEYPFDRAPVAEFVVPGDHRNAL